MNIVRSPIFVRRPSQHSRYLFGAVTLRPHHPGHFGTYYSPAVNYLSALDLFENSYFDAFASGASSLASMGTFYATNENGIANAITDTRLEITGRSIYVHGSIAHGAEHCNQR
jgi:hypothetical protein